MEAVERNVIWILVVSPVMSYLSGYLNLLVYYPLYPPTKDAWFYLASINTLFFILTTTTSALCKARFLENLTYKLSVTFFAVSMILLSVQALNRLF